MNDMVGCFGYRCFRPTIHHEADDGVRRTLDLLAGNCSKDDCLGSRRDAFLTRLTVAYACQEK